MPNTVGPGKEERDFDVEDDEQQRDDVEPQVELHEARADRRLAALVDFELFRVRVVRPQEPADQQVDEQEHEAGAGKQGQVGDDGDGCGHSADAVRKSKAGKEKGPQRRPYAFVDCKTAARLCKRK